MTSTSPLKAAIEIIRYPSPYGSGALLWQGGLLTGHLLPGSRQIRNIARGLSAAPAAKAGALAVKLESYFQGERVEFREGELPVDWSAGGPFQEKVRRALAEIPYGEAVSYADLAGAAGHPRAHRAVGNVMAANSIPVLLPCHRVIRSDGRPGGFTAGEDWKSRLLEIEGLRLPPPFRRARESNKL
ncbi:MAG: MGMT family protein [Thermoleophilia bacterium]|nr:MGMT family protein [Thermoleophilia bacterium]